MIVTASGRILTNAHVVNGADDIKVTLQDGTDYEAKVVGIDAKADLAVLQLEGQGPRAEAAPVRRLVGGCGSARSCSRSAIRSASARR